MQSVEDIIVHLKEKGDYVCDKGLATAIFVAHTLNKPLLLEGAPGVGKTQFFLAHRKAYGQERF